MDFWLVLIIRHVYTDPMNTVSKCSFDNSFLLTFSMSSNTRYESISQHIIIILHKFEIECLLFTGNNKNQTEKPINEYLYEKLNKQKPKSKDRNPT